MSMVLRRALARLDLGRRAAAICALALAALAAAPAAHAAQPEPWGLGLQESASPLKDQAAAFHDLLLVVIFLISIFVMALLAYVIWRFNAARNPNASKTTHNVTIEIIWTVVPVVILVIVFIPGIRLLYYTDAAVNAEMTVKVQGRQWYWAYEYPDHGAFTFDSYMIPEADLKPGQPRLLEVDNRMVVPVGTDIRILVTSADVMHSWFMPALGVQKYAFPGRVNELWIRVDKPGVYYGQCNQICGINHAFMPIAVEALPKEQFVAWAEQAKAKFAAAAPAPAVQVAAAPPAR